MVPFKSSSVLEYGSFRLALQKLKYKAQTKRSILSTKRCGTWTPALSKVLNIGSELGLRRTVPPKSFRHDICQRSMTRTCPSLVRKVRPSCLVVHAPTFSRRYVIWLKSHEVQCKGLRLAIVVVNFACRYAESGPESHIQLFELPVQEASDHINCALHEAFDSRHDSRFL